MAETPNILLITADHMGWSTICGRSVCRTPNLNRLAQEGLRFDRSYTAVSVCCPSRAMLLSGAYPWHNGVFNQVHVKEAVRRDMFPDVVTYPRRLRDAGYRLGYVGKWHASALRGPMDFGYDVMREIPWLGPECAERLGPHVENSPDPAGGKPPRLVDPVYVTWPGGDRVQVCAGVDAPPAQDVSCRIAEAGARTIGEFAAGRQPWLVEVHFQQPHDPYRPLLCFLENYRLEDIELPRSYYEETFEGKPGLLAREASLWAELGEEDFRQALRSGTTTPSASRWTTSPGPSWTLWRLPVRPTTRWWCSPQTTATWLARTACSSRAGCRTRKHAESLCSLAGPV